MQKTGKFVIDKQMNSVLIRYHEIALKKGNRSYFTELLRRNLLSAVKDLDVKEIRILPARLLLAFNNDIDSATVASRIRTVFGVANFSVPCRNPKRRHDISPHLSRDQPAVGGSRQRTYGRPCGSFESRIHHFGGDSSSGCFFWLQQDSWRRRLTGRGKRTGRFSDLGRY